MKNLKKIIAVVSGLIAPFVVYAQSFSRMAANIVNIIQRLFELVMILGVVVFLYGIIIYIYSAGDERKRSSAKNYIIYGLIGLFVMFGFWGIIELVKATFGFSYGAP